MHLGSLTPGNCVSWHSGFEGRQSVKTCATVPLESSDGNARGVLMTEDVLAARDHFVGRTYQDIAHADGGPLPNVLRERSNPTQQTQDIPFSRYVDKAFFDLEMRKMWPRVWQYACREEHVPEIGDYYVYDIGRRSLIIVRTSRGLRAYHNSCLHRGTKLKPSASSGWSA